MSRHWTKSIQDAINKCKEHFDTKIKHFSGKFNADIQRIQAQLEDIKNRTN